MLLILHLHPNALPPALPACQGDLQQLPVQQSHHAGQHRQSGSAGRRHPQCPSTRHVQGAAAAGDAYRFSAAHGSFPAEEEESIEKSANLLACVWNKNCLMAVDDLISSASDVTNPEVSYHTLLTLSVQRLCEAYLKIFNSFSQTEMIVLCGTVLFSSLYRGHLF